ISCSTPSRLATRSTMSTSKPTILSPSLNWNGSYGTLVHTVSLPGFTSLTASAPSAEALAEVVADPPEPPLPHGVMVRAAADAFAPAAQPRRVMGQRGMGRPRRIRMQLKGEFCAV